MSRKGLFWMTGSAAVAVLAVGAGFLWWTRGRAEAYSGMAAHFPDTTAVFVEVRHIGQWMQLPAETPAQPEPIRSQDPLLGVIGRVWAAERIRPEDLPTVLKDQPFAVGFWKDGAAWKGAGLMAVAPAVRQPLEEFLKGKLGQGAPAGEVSGIKLYKIDPPKSSEGMDLAVEAASQLVWGVGDSWAVVASSLEEARQVLSSPARPLDTDPAFLESAAHFPVEKGGWIFVRSTALVSAAEKAGKCLGEKPGEEPEGSSKAHPEKPSSPAAKGGEEVSGALGSFMTSFLSAGSVPCIAMWSCPPQSAEGIWDVRAWVGKDRSGKGLFNLLTDGGSRRPDLLRRVPKDGTVYVWGGGEDPAGFYKRFMDELARVAPADKVSTVRAAIGAAEGKLGVSIANDLLPTLGDEMCVVLKKQPGDEGAKEEESAALYISLRDSRRLQSLLREKVGPSLGLVESSVQGTPGWSWKPKGDDGEKPGPQFLVTADALVITESPAWAMGSSSEGKSYKLLAAQEGKFALLAVAEGEGESAGKQPLTVTGTREDDGVLVKVSFSGKRPKVPFFESPECQEKEAPQAGAPDAGGAKGEKGSGDAKKAAA